MTDKICQYGNCQETDTPILVSNSLAGERNRFCCAEHAALYLLKTDWRREGWMSSYRNHITEQVWRDLGGEKERAPVQLGKWTLVHE